MCYVYIIFSESRKRFYTGMTTSSPEARLARHNNASYGLNHFTAIGRPWTMFLSMKCTDVRHARRVELHLKKMKSSKYLRNLKKYPELRAKILHKYQ